jgi:hypothetical protein
VEPFINNYQKFNSNSGWACDDDGWCEVGSMQCGCTLLSLGGCQTVVCIEMFLTNDGWCEVGSSARLFLLSECAPQSAAAGTLRVCLLLVGLPCSTAAAKAKCMMFDQG